MLILVSQSNLIQQRLIRVGLAEMGASTPGGPGACSPGKF